MPGILSVDTFKSKLTGGGARSNMFRVLMNFPAYAQANAEVAAYMAKAAIFPASTTTVIKVPFRGREVPVEGDRTFAPFTITFYNDVDHKLRDAFVRWKNEISRHSGNIGLSNPADYQIDFQVQQLKKDETVATTYNIRSAFPTEVGEITLGYDQNNILQEFPVIFECLYWDKDGVAN